MKSAHVVLLLVTLLLHPLSMAAAEPTLRGFQIGRYISDAELDELKTEWNVNLVRIQVGDNERMDGTTGSDYIEMMEEVFAEIDPLLEKLSARDIKVVFALYSPPGGFQSRNSPSHHAIFSDRGLQLDFIDMWRRIITRYNGHAAIHAFDLLNEPAMSRSHLTGGAVTWNELLKETIAAIRVLAPDALLMVKSLYGDPSKLGSLPPLLDANIVYSYHPYVYLPYQHTGIYEYPSFIKRPSKANVQKKLGALLGRFFFTHHKRFRAGTASGALPRLNAGEIAVSAMASEGGTYLRDLVSVIESGDGSKINKRKFSKKRLKLRTYKDFIPLVNHESWTVHAFDEARVWDPRYNCTAVNSCTFVGTTDRTAVLKEALN